jgi:CPA1 family monovalent cation:H+ antiporter
VRQEFIAHLGSIDADLQEGEARRFAHTDLHRRALQAARQTVLAMRASDEIGDDAFHQMEEELDWIEMSGGGKDDAEPES